MPISAQFDPDLVFLSVSADATKDQSDKSEFLFRTKGVAMIINFLSSLADGRVIVALDGYNDPKYIMDCATVCAAMLGGLPGCPEEVNKEGSHQNRPSLDTVKENIRPFWSLLGATASTEII